MALTVTVEDGTGLSNANSYVSRAEATSYFEGHLYGTSWSGATTTQQDQSIVMATRVLDAQMIWNGFKSSNNQALQWPRQQCPDPDRYMGLTTVQSGGSIISNSNMVPDDEVPKAIKDAVCELAGLLMTSNRTSDPQGQGIRRLDIHNGIEISFDPNNPIPIMPEIVQNMVSKYGTMRGSGGFVKVRRT